MLQYVVTTSTNVFVSAVGKALARSPPTLSSPEQHLPSFLAVAHHHIGQEEDLETKEPCLVR